MKKMNGKSNRIMVIRPEMINDRNAETGTILHELPKNRL